MGLLRKTGRWLLTERKESRNRSVEENGKVVTNKPLTERKESRNSSVGENGKVVTNRNH